MKNKESLSKIVATLAFILLVQNFAISQEMIKGFKGGLNLSYLNLENSDNIELLPGFHAGLWGKKMLTDNFGVQHELLFTSKGVKSVYNEEILGFPVADGTTELVVNYLESPLYAVFQPTKYVNFHAGPYFSILLNSKVETDAEILNFIEVDNSDEVDRENFHTFDVGFSGGIDFTFKPVTVGVNYSVGFRPVAEEGEPLENLIENSRNHAIMIHLGLAFDADKMKMYHKKESD